MPRSRWFHVYILTNRRNTTFYIGVTGNLFRRVHEHKSGAFEGFTKKYRLHKLVYYEEFQYSFDAITREKQLKNWHREWKLNLVRSTNPDFVDLAFDLYENRDNETNSDPETSSG